MLVLGIDPGTASTGFGVVRATGSRLDSVDTGVISTRAGIALEHRLADIHARVGELLDEYRPAALAIEDAISGGVRRVHVIGYRSPDAILAEVFTNEGTGTLIVADIKALSSAEQQSGPGEAVD